MIEKIIQELKETQKEWTKEDFLLGELMEDVIEIVQEVAKEYGNGWIPCSERMPKDEEEVLVWFEYFRYGNYNCLFQRHGLSFTLNGEWSGFINGSSGWQQLKVIAWQPLPTPYQKGE